MYQVLYRKWRPQKFSDVSGQPQVTRTLENELKSGRINHAYLLQVQEVRVKQPALKYSPKPLTVLIYKTAIPAVNARTVRVLTTEVF